MKASEAVKNTDQFATREDRESGIIEMKVREGYKHRKLGWIPEGWKVQSLEDLAVSVKSGLSRRLSNEDIGLPVLRSNNLIDNNVDFREIKYWFIDDPQGANTDNYFLKDGDILVNFINSLAQIGKCASFHNGLNRDIIYTTNILNLRLDKGKIVPTFFLNYTLTSRYKNYIQSITKPAVNQASFTTKDFKRFAVVLPPLPEQQKIALILSTWDKAITKTEQLIAKKQQRKKGLMQQILTGKKRFREFVKSDKMKATKLGLIPEDWGVKTLGDIGTFLKGKGVSKAMLINKGLPCLTYGELYTKHHDIIRDFRSYINESSANESIVLEFGDILFAGSGETLKEIGKSAAYISNFEAYAGGDIIILRNHDQCPEYLGYLLNHDIVNRQKYRIGQGHSVVHIYSSSLKNILIPIPKDDEQQKIASVLSAADNEIAALQKQLDKLKKQKKGLMQKLLTGEVRVKIK